MPNHIVWAPRAKGVWVRAYPSHSCLCQEWRLLDTHSEMPHKQGLLEVYEFSLTRVFEGKIQFTATTTDTKNIRLTKSSSCRNAGEGGILAYGNLHLSPIATDCYVTTRN